MKIFSDVRVARYLTIGLLVAAATFGFATSAQARVLLGSPGPAPLSTGLVGYWPLDGAVTNWTTNTTADLSGNGNTGTIYTLGTTTSPVAGKIGQAFTFSGVPQYVRVADANSLDVGDVVSYSLWIKRGRKGLQEVFFSKDFTTAVAAFESNGTVSLYKHASGLIIGATQTIASASPILTDTNWHHVVVTGTAAIIGSQFEIGRANSAYFGGILDDVRVYNRTLSATEVKQLYNMGR